MPDTQAPLSTPTRSTLQQHLTPRILKQARSTIKIRYSLLLDALWDAVGEHGAVSPPCLHQQRRPSLTVLLAPSSRATCGTRWDLLVRVSDFVYAEHSFVMVHGW